MSIEPVEQERMLSVIQRQIDGQRKQLETSQQILDEIIQIRDEVNSSKKEVNKRFVIMEEMVQEVRDSVTLSDSECYDLQILVFNKSNQLTKDRYSEEDGNYKTIVGKHRRSIWKEIKRHFKVARYSHIRRIDFEDAKAFTQLYKPEEYM